MFAICWAASYRVHAVVNEGEQTGKLLECTHTHTHTHTHIHIHCRHFYTHSHKDAIRSGVLNETVWSFISAPRVFSPAPFRLLHTSLQQTPVQFLQARASLSLIVEGGKEGWEDRDSSIVWLPWGCVTGTWTQFNRTGSTAATEVPKAPRLKKWGILSITRLDCYMCTKHIASYACVHTNPI